MSINRILAIAIGAASSVGNGERAIARQGIPDTNVICEFFTTIAPRM
jgi:hypothetical protein